MDIKWLLFSFSGRLNRKPFWLFTLGAGLVWLILSLLLGIDITPRGRDAKSIIPMLILLWPSLSVQAKRWHDRDKSAWWLLINAVPIVGPIWSFIENGCLPGTSGENSYGDDPLGGKCPCKPIPDDESGLPESVPPAEWTPAKYYLSPLMKTMMIVASVLVFLASLLFIAVGKLTSVEFPGGIIPFAIMDTLIISVVVWRMMKPVVELSETGLRIGIPFLFKTNTAKWDELDGMVVGEINTLGYKENTVKLLLKTGMGTTKEMQVSLKAVEKPDEIIERLRLKIPEKGYEDLKHAQVLQRPSTKGEIKYRGLILNEAGLARGKEAISWSDVRELKYAGLVIAGYGTTTISYTGSGGIKKSIVVQPKASDEYLEFIKYLLQHSPKASIDPGLVKALEYHPKDARADLYSVFLFLAGIVLSMITGSFIFWYTDGISAGIMNAALLIPFGLVPLAIAVKVLSGRFRGTSGPSSKKILWSALSNIGPAVSVPIFFILSPFSFYWVAGDLSVKVGDIKKAEGYYLAALEKLPGSIDVLYEMGKLNREKQDYEKAFNYLKEAYTKDPAYWGPKAVELIPDTLMKMGRYEEALTWCDRILKDLPGKRDIELTINDKKDEIAAEKKLNEPKQNMP